MKHITTSKIITGFGVAAFAFFAAASALAAPTLSETSVTVALGQSATVSSQGTSTAVYMSSNSSPNVASVQANGTRVTVTGGGLGSTLASICYAGTASDCTNLSVNVQATVSALSFSQNNFTITQGQTFSVVVSGGNGTYSITGNSNSAVASTTIFGSSVSIQGISSGSTNITVCDGTNVCGTISATVGTTQASTPTGLFGATSPSVAVGSNVNIPLNGGGTFLVSSNPSPSVAQTNINGSTLVITGVSAGSDSVTVCAAATTCDSLYINVTPASSAPVPSSPVPSTTTLSTTPVSTTVSTPVISTSNTASVLATIQSMQSALTQILTQIQSRHTTLTQLTASVAAANGTNGASSVSAGGTFTEFLTIGTQDAQVTALQQKLTALGFYAGPITGFFGAQTMSAVEKYQTAHGIAAKGYVGPDTRTLLNSGN